MKKSAQPMLDSQSKPSTTLMMVSDAGFEAFKQILFEFWGTYVLFLIGLGATVAFGGPIGGIAFGVAYVGLHAWLKSVSGAHFNPYVTILEWCLGYMPGGYSIGSFFLMGAFIGVQILAGFVAPWTLLFFNLPSVAPTVPSSLITSFGQVLLAEWLLTLTFLLVRTGTHRCRGRHADMINSSVYQGFFYGVSVAVLAALSTGGSLNFARSLGPGVIAGTMTKFGAYPLAGVLSIVAAFALHKIQCACYVFNDGFLGLRPVITDMISVVDQDCTECKSTKKKCHRHHDK